MKQSRILTLMFCVLFLSGCVTQSPEGPSGSLVRQIVATAEGRDYFLRRFYNTDDKMEPILLTLRSLRPHFSPDQDVDALDLPVLCITLSCSDGTERLYRLKDVRFLQTGTGDWKKVDTGKAARLWELLWQLPDDPENSRSFHHPLPRIHGVWRYPLPFPRLP